MTPKDKKSIHVMANANTAYPDRAWAVRIEQGQISAFARYENSVLVLKLTVLDNSIFDPRYRRAKKLADKSAASFFKRPVFMGQTMIKWGDSYPLFTYREQQFKRGAR